MPKVGLISSMKGAEGEWLPGHDITLLTPHTS